MFGGASQFSFGSSAPSNPFGATTTTTTAAPAQTGFLFGSTPAASAAPTGLNSTFTFGTPTANAAAPTATATQPLTFGSTLQNSTAIRPFGSTTAFGSTATATTPATGTTGFGGTSLFGATQPAAQTTSLFGATQPAFGAAQPAQTTSIFGAPVGAATQVGTTVKFEAVAGQDTMRTKNNTFQTINTKLQCVCAMKEYINKSLEELRMEDYQANRKFPSATSIFGATSFAPTTPFSSTPFAASTAFPTASTASTTTNIFGAASTTTASPFAAPAVTPSPFAFGATSAAPATNIFGAPAATTTSPFGTATATAPAVTSIFGATQPTTSIFGASTAASPFGAKPATTQPSFGFGTATSASPAFSFGSQPAATTSIFSQPATATPFGAAAPAATTNIFGAPTSTAATAPAVTSIFGAQPATTNIFGAATSTAAPVFGAATSTPAFTGFGVAAPASTATSIFGAPAATTSTAAPIFGGFGAQAATSTASPFSFAAPAASTAAPTLFGAPAATTSSIFNPQPFTGFGLTQSQPAAAATATQPFSFSTGFGSTTSLAAPAATVQPQVQQTVSFVQQRFLAQSLLDPFASRGKKDFSNIGQIKPPTDLIVMSTSSTATTTTTAATSTTAPITLPLQPNARKTSSARPLVDIRFKLRPVTSSPTSSPAIDDIKSPNPQPTTPLGQVKSPLTADFSEEEEQLLIGKNKMSKLRLSNDFIESSFQSESIRSLYPTRRLAELEAMANINNNTHIISTGPAIPFSTSSSTTIDTASAYASSTTVNSEQTLHPSSNNRAMLPLHHSTPLIVHKQSPPPIPHQSATLVQSPTSPPPRSTTPPPPLSSSNNTFQRSKLAKTHSDTRAFNLPKLSQDDYYMRPSTAELKSLFDDRGQCLVKEFTVGHELYGSVTFYGQVNVAGLDLDRIIRIDRHEVTVYPDDNNKPPMGEELNIPARITLLDVYPTDRTTRAEITDVARIKAMNYGEYLREVTKKFDGEFVNYNATDGSWTFTVKHFTRYGLDGDEDDFVVMKPPQQQQQQQQPQPPPPSKPINLNFLDQTIALNDTYALSSPKSQGMDMEEKENSTTLFAQHQQQQNQVRFTNQSLIGLRPSDVEQLAQSMFCDDDEDDFDGFQQATDRMITSTKIIPSNHRPVPVLREPLIEKSSTTEHDKTQLTFNAPAKPVLERAHTKLPKLVANVRGRYFRTNFSPQLQYGAVDPLNETRILLQTPVKFNEHAADELGSFLTSYFESCAQAVETPASLPHFRVRQDPDVVQRFIRFYTEIVEGKNMDDQSSVQSLTDYSLQVLDLCRLLWGPIETPMNVQTINQAYFEDQKRRQMLSSWLHQCLLSQPQQQQWIMQNCELLSRGLFHDCVKFAQDEGDLRLAALVHAASGSDNVREVLRHCAHEDIVDVYSKDFQRSIAILSGEFIVKGHNLVDQNRTIYWQMALALHLWFANASSDSISTIVHDFETGYGGKYWLKPIAHYGNTEVHDLRWKLLKLHTDDTFPMDQVFDVRSYTDNAFDYQLSWMLYITLQSLGSHPLPVESDTGLHVNFAQQLEHLDYWQLSVFVLLHINDPTNREKMVREFLHRHVSSDIHLNQDEQALIDKYAVPEKLILATKAQRAEYDKRWTNAVHLWINAKQWRKAHDIYCSYVFHDTLLRGNYEEAKEVLDSLDHQRANISHWNRRGGFARQYVDLLIHFDRIRHGQDSLSNRAQSSILAEVHRLCGELDLVIADKHFKKISLVEISRRLLSLLNYFLICSHLPNLSNDNDENFAKKLNLFHQSLLSSVPCSLPLDLLLQQIKFKSRSHR